MSQINAVFIFCSNKSRHEKWAKNWTKIECVCIEINDLCEVVEQAVKQCTQQSIQISFTKNSDKSPKENLDVLDSSFMYTQILKEILFETDLDNQHMKDFLKYCRQIFAGNDRILKNCDKIEQDYRKHTPAWWYACESFLHSMADLAIRLVEVDLMVQMGFFIRDLCEQIKYFHSEQFDSVHKSDPFTVYCGQGLSKTDFNELMEAKDKLLPFNNFLLTSKNRKISVSFAEEALPNLDRIGVLFVMNIDPSISPTPFMNVGNMGYYEDEEILFSMHSVFRINDIKKINNNDYLWKVNLTLTSDGDNDSRILTECIREETQGPSGRHRLVKLLLKVGEFVKAEQLCNVLLSQANDNHKKK